MHSVSAGLWDPLPPSKDGASFSPQPPSISRLAHVTSATPAKRITFYRSGDSQFGGVKMAIHRRSFKCFDALLDDLSQKVPLPFGVRTVTTPRGTHSIRHLDQLQDGACYLCSESRRAKPVDMELAGRRPAVWHHPWPHRPEGPSAGPAPHPQRRRMLLVKNSDPGLRRSVVLSRRSARSLRAFLEEVSDVMQFHVRKLYTAEGRKIDTVQSLMKSPGVLVCAGREPFSPLLLELIRKSSEEKLPGLGRRSPGLGPRTPGNGSRSPATQGVRSSPHGTRSRASEYSEGQESRKNVNFGLETRKSIIHPRSDSSTRSTRFSLSSEKSCPNGLSCSHSQARPAIGNDDIEKRVLVNKDGSLSVEMKVRFRLHNDESLQWSTQIKKYPPPLTNDCCPLREAQPCYLQQGRSETCSDPDSPEGCHDYSNNHCPCCHQKQEQNYDLWENPAHSNKHPPKPPPDSSRPSHTRVRQAHSSSSSSSCHSCRVVCRRSRLSSSRGGSGLEQGQLVQEELCMTEEVQRRIEVEQDGDRRVQVCTISRCCSSSGGTAADVRPHSTRSMDNDQSEKAIDFVHEEPMLLDGEERPQSIISNSSHILQALQEDQDEEDEELPPSVSQCCQSPSPASQIHLTTHLTSNESNSAAHSPKHRMHNGLASLCSAASPQQDGQNSRASSCHCGAATPHSMGRCEEMERATISKSKTSRASHGSCKSKTLSPEEDGVADDEERVESGLSRHCRLPVENGPCSRSNACSCCGGHECMATPCPSACENEVQGSSSRASQRSCHSHSATSKSPTHLSDQENACESSKDEQAPSGMSDGSAISTRSNKSHHDWASLMSNGLQGRAASAMSQDSTLSKLSSSPSPPGEPLAEPEVNPEEGPLSVASATSRSHRSGGNSRGKIELEENRSTSTVSVKSNVSAKSSASHKSTKVSGRSGSPMPETTDDIGDAAEKAGEDSTRSMHNGTANCTKTSGGNAGGEEGTDDILERAESALSATAKSETLGKSCTSCKSRNSHVSSAALKSTDTPDDAGEEAAQEDEIRPDSVLSAMSAKSAKSTKSLKSHCSHCAKVASPDPDAVGDEALLQGEEIDGRAASVMSAKSNKSYKSTKVTKSLPLGPEAVDDDAGRAASAMSAVSVSTKSAKSCKSNCNNHSRTPSPSLAFKEGAQEMEEEAVNEKAVVRPESVMSAKSAKSIISVKSHKSSCICSSADAASPDHYGGEVGEKVVVEMGNCNEDAERAASTMSAKSATSVVSSRSNRDEDAEATIETKAGEVAGGKAEGEDCIEERVDSALSVKSAQSNRPARSHTSKSTVSSTAASPTGDTVEKGPETICNRSPSSLSVTSNVSATSSKSKSQCNGYDPNLNTACVLTIETNGVENQNEEQLEDGKLAEKSILSVRTGQRASGATSKYSERSDRSHKSKCTKCIKAVSTDPKTPDILKIKAPEVISEEGKEKTLDRSPSEMSLASEKTSMSEAKLHEPTSNVIADIPINNKGEADDQEGESPPSANSSKTTSTVKAKPVSVDCLLSTQELSPDLGDGETRGPSVMSVQSKASSNHFKCCCGASSKHMKTQKREGENNEDEEEKGDAVEEKEAAKQAPSVQSSKSKRSRRVSGGRDTSLSQESLGSVSLLLPKDQQGNSVDSGKSTISTHDKTQTPNNPKTKEECAPKDTEDVGHMTKAQDVVQPVCNGGESFLPPFHKPSDIPTIETTGGSLEGEKVEGQMIERSASALSSRSNLSVKSSKSHKCTCNACVKALSPKPITERDNETERVRSRSTTRVCSSTGNHLEPSDKRATSAMFSSSGKGRRNTPLRASPEPTIQAVNSDESASNEVENQATTTPTIQANGKDNIPEEQVPSVKPRSPIRLRPDSAASARSGTKLKASNEDGRGERSSQSSPNLELKDCKLKSDAGSDNDSVRSAKTSKSEKTESHKESCPAVNVENSSESTLSHSLSAADLLRETMADACPRRRQSKGSCISNKTRSEKGGRQRSKKPKEVEAGTFLTPAYLPNASPNEVVSNWLQSIPADSCMCEVGDELREVTMAAKMVDEEPLGDVTREEENPANPNANEASETSERAEDGEEAEEKKESGEKVEKGEEGSTKEGENSDVVSADADVTSSGHDPIFMHSESSSRNCHSSVAVMKVLLSPGLGRCKSLPEVSPVYGRKLSASAKGLLDCLAQLQLIEPIASRKHCEVHKDRNERYKEVMGILQSLWLTEPQDVQKADAPEHQIAPPRSCSGVETRSGSAGLGKDDGHNDGGDETPAKPPGSVHEEEEADAGDGEEEREHPEAEAEESPEPSEEPAKTELNGEEASAPRQDVTVTKEASTDCPSSPKDGDTLPCLDSAKATETPSSSGKNSAVGSSKSPTDNEQETLEYSSSGTPHTALQAPPTKHISQDPDPVWVLHLLKKLEKQFISHYVDAMAEFKVRWELEDNVLLDTMISELRDEVSRRIQRSIGRELRKIQGRAGRGGRSPRPPQGGNLSRESTMTERRRQMMKVMKNQSVKTGDSLSDGETTGDYSDQRSDDEYCPCDACMRKKMAARPIKTQAPVSTAPVMMEFDLLKILQLKKDPEPRPSAPPLPPDDGPLVSNGVGSDPEQEEGWNLEVVEEEEEDEQQQEEKDEDEGQEEEMEETKEDIVASVVLEETVPEEEEEEAAGRQAEGGGEEEREPDVAEEVVENGDEGGDEEEEEGAEKVNEAGGESAGEGGRGEEEDEEEERQECHCQGAKRLEEAEYLEMSQEGGGDGGEEAGESAGGEEGEGTTTEGGVGEEKQEDASREMEDDVDGAAANGGCCHREVPTPVVCVTEGEEADGGDSDTERKQASDTSADEPGLDAAGTTAGVEETDEGGDTGEVAEEAVEGFECEEEGGKESSKGRGETCALCHQHTRTSVESQPGSMEGMATRSASSVTSPTESPETGAKMAVKAVSTSEGAAGRLQRGSRSPARVKRHKPKESDIELDDLEF